MGWVLPITIDYFLVEQALLCLRQNQATVSLRKSLIDPVSGRSSTELCSGHHKQGHFKGYLALYCFGSG